MTLLAHLLFQFLILALSASNFSLYKGKGILDNYMKYTHEILLPT